MYITETIDNVDKRKYERIAERERDYRVDTDESRGAGFCGKVVCDKLRLEHQQLSCSMQTPINN